MILLLMMKELGSEQNHFPRDLDNDADLPPQNALKTKGICAFNYSSLVTATKKKIDHGIKVKAQLEV